MSELLLSEHEALDGGTFTPSTFLGSYATNLLGRYLAARSAQSGGGHDVQFLNFFESVCRLLGNTFDAYIYKDSSDSNLQFSCKPFSWVLGGLTFTYAGGINLGPLTAGATRLIWADLSHTTVAIGVGAALPTDRLCLPLRSIAAPAAGPWKLQHATLLVPRYAVRPHGGGGMVVPIGIDFTFATATGTPIVVVPAGTRVVRSAIKIDTVFNGSSPSVSIGDSADNNRLLNTSAVTETALGNYTGAPNHKYAAQTTINFYRTGSGQTTGAGFAMVELMF